MKHSKSGTDRTGIYRHLFEHVDCPINKDALPDYEDLFCEPFYQFMRQQFLAYEIEKAHELGADIVSVLHIAPAHDHDFCKVTSPRLVELGDSATHVWEKIVKKGRFISVSTEKSFGDLFKIPIPKIDSWKEYIGSRYKWIKQ